MGKPSSITCSNKLPLEGKVMQLIYIYIYILHNERMEGVEVGMLGLRWHVKVL
jgi:hypothetical protein